MGRNRSRATGRREGGSFVPLPHSVIASPEFAKLNGWSVKALMDLLAAYKGKNNGDLALTWSMAKERGWKSPSTLARALKHLQDARFVIKSRQGGRNQCSLFAVTFYAVDECNGKHELAPTHAPPAYWKDSK